MKPIRKTGRYVGPMLLAGASAGWIALTGGWNRPLWLLAAYGLLNVLAGWIAGSGYDRLYATALRDDLTRAYNRRFFTRIVPKLIEKAADNKITLSVSVLDCDHFKKINDQYGHATGDKVLQGVARMLIRNTRKDDYVIRYGGDEFVIIASSVDHSRTRSMMARLEGELAKLSAELSVPLSVSVGTALYPQDGTRLDELLHTADVRMYEYKAATRVKPPAATAAVS